MGHIKEPADRVDDLTVEHVWAISIVGAIAAIVLLLWIPRRRVARWSKRTDNDEPVAISLVGGGTWFTMWWPLGATWPLVRLDQFSWGIRVGPNVRLMAWIIPTTDMRWAEILTVRRTRTTLRFTTRSAPNHWLSFGPGVDPRLVSAIVDHGVNYQERSPPRTRRSGATSPP